MRPALPNIIETSIEYSLSISLASTNDPKLPMPSAEDMVHVLTKLEKIREKYINYALTESSPQTYTALEQSLRSSVIEKTLTVRGEAYRIHIEEIFLELYEEHIGFFMDKYGFDPEAILETIDYIEYSIKENQLIVKEEHKEFIKWFEAQDMQRLARTYGSGDPFLSSKAYQLETGKSPRFKAIDEQFRFIEGELSNEQKQVIHQLSLKFGENVNFLNPKFKALPLNDSLVNSKPILYDDNNSAYFCFSTRILHRNLFNIAEGLIKNADNAYFNDTYLGKGKKARSTYFENKVAQLINKMIPNQTIQTNLKYKIGSTEYEIDVLVETQNHIYLVEVKSGLYSNESKRGAIKALKTDLSNLVGYAATQVARTEDYIKKPEHLFYHKNGATLTVDGNKPIVKIAVSFDSITGITNQLYNLTQLGILQ